MKAITPEAVSDGSEGKVDKGSGISNTSSFELLHFLPSSSESMSKPTDPSKRKDAVKSKEGTGVKKEIPRSHKQVGQASQTTSESVEKEWGFATTMTSAESDSDLLSSLSQPTPTPDAFGFSLSSDYSPGWIPFKESTISVAVDVSGSTKGKVLHEEKLVIMLLSLWLSSDASARFKVLPWDYDAHPILSTDEIFSMKSGAGTRPSAIFSSSSFLEALKGSSLWFLLTDGLIDVREVTRFAEGIADHGLHGAACVVILLGNMSSTPMDLNVSVGIAVFAATPHCLFLFHDVATGDVYVLQSKGCFTKIISPSSVTSLLDSSTTWGDLPRTCYRQLAQLDIPRPHINLDKDDLILSRGQVIKMEDVYLNRLDIHSVSDIFDNDADMKNILLTGATRGRSEDVKAWVSRQSFPQENVLLIPRPDIDGKAFELTGKLLKLMKGKHEVEDKRKLQAELRMAHFRNWKSFQLTINRYNRNKSHQASIVKDSKRRLDETDSGTFSYSILSSVYSPRGPSTATLSSKRLRMGQKSSCHPISEIDEKQPRSSEKTSFSQPPRESSSTGQGKDSSPLYTTHYRRLNNAPSNLEFTGECGFCESSERPLALLLRVPKENTPMKELPAPGDRAKHDHSAMATESMHPTVDIISRFICCDPCSCFLRKVGEAPSNEKIVGAILLTSYAENRSQWISALDEALAQRFEEDSIELVFLDILRQSKHMNLSVPSQPTTMQKAIKWAISNIEEQIACAKNRRLVT